MLFLFCVVAVEVELLTNPEERGPRRLCGGGRPLDGVDVLARAAFVQRSAPERRYGRILDLLAARGVAEEVLDTADWIIR